MNEQKEQRMKRERRRARVRARVSGTAERPRLSVHRSIMGMFAQLIDDVAGKTILAAHTKTAKLTGDAGERKGKMRGSYLLGKAIAEAAKAKGVSAVVFDRGAYQYHGRVAAFAEGARDGGLQF
jgi:large subunit ribosomal protein L18